jgi:hypothetical protein
MIQILKPVIQILIMKSNLPMNLFIGKMILMNKLV